MSYFDDMAYILQEPDLSGLTPAQKYAINLNRDSTLFSAGGKLTQGIGQIVGGFQAAQNANYSADQLRVNAGQEKAASQRDMISEDQRSQRVQSEILARAAASGGGASDPTVVNIMARTAGEGAYRKAVALYHGDEAARAMTNQANAVEYEGKMAKHNAIMGGIGSIFSAGTNLISGGAGQSSLFQRFGNGGPGMFGGYGGGGPY